MRLIKITFTLLAAGWVATAQATENGVMVDLSVLDGLNNTYSAPAEPMFPIMPKAAPRAKVQQPKAQKNVQKPIIKEGIPDVVKKDKVVLDSQEEVEVVDVEPVLPQAEVKQPDNIEVPAKEIITKKIEEQVQPRVEEVVVPTAEVNIELPTKDDATKVDNEIKAINSAVANIENSAAGLESAAEKIEEKSEQVEAKMQEEALLVAAPKIINKPSNAIVFAEDVDELSEEQMQEIDNIVSAYKNEKNNKVAIYSYNVDNGVDSFRKKRVSLNRAIEIRSYLLKKGFKNFSIKVVNIAEDSPKINMVEISEI